MAVTAIIIIVLFYNSFMNHIFSFISVSNLVFLALCVIMSLVIGSLWFHPRVFGNVYARWMGLPVPKPGQMPKGMAMTFIAEIISRILYFGFFTVFFYFGTNGSEHVTLFTLLFVIVVFYVGLIFPTQLSQIAWTKAQKKAVILIGGNTLLQTLIAGCIWFWFFI